MSYKSKAEGQGKVFLYTRRNRAGDTIVYNEAWMLVNETEEGFTYYNPKYKRCQSLRLAKKYPKKNKCPNIKGFKKQRFLQAGYLWFDYDYFKELKNENFN